MHARELAELAALVAVNSPALLRAGASVSFTAVEQYWTASKCRLDRWSRLLRQLAAADGPESLAGTLAWPRVRPVLEEALISELLTRIWAATGVALDRSQGDQNLEPVARNIFTWHVEVRRRLLALLAEGRVLDQAQAAHLDQLRRRVERWGDMLLAHLTPAVDVSEFAFEPDRAHDFAEDLDREAVAAERQFSSQLVVSSLRASFAHGLADRTPNIDLNRKIGSAILDAIREQLDESSGLVKSAWLARMNRTASDTQDMIDELLRL